MTTPINTVTSILTSIITNASFLTSDTSSVPSGSHTKIYVKSDSTLSYNELGWATLGPPAHVGLNTTISETRYLNDDSYSIITITLLHEVLHILGIINVDERSNDFIISSDTVDTTIQPARFLWNGPNGVAGYKDVIEANDLSSTGISIIIEDGGGSGTNVHISQIISNK